MFFRMEAIVASTLATILQSTFASSTTSSVSAALMAAGDSLPVLSNCTSWAEEKRRAKKKGK